MPQCRRCQAGHRWSRAWYSCPQANGSHYIDNVFLALMARQTTNVLPRKSTLRGECLKGIVMHRRDFPRHTTLPLDPPRDTRHVRCDGERCSNNQALRGGSLGLEHPQIGKPRHRCTIRGVRCCRVLNDVKRTNETSPFRHVLSHAHTRKAPAGSGRYFQLVAQGAAHGWLADRALGAGQNFISVALTR